MRVHHFIATDNVDNGLINFFARRLLLPPLDPTSSSIASYDRFGAAIQFGAN